LTEKASDKVTANGRPSGIATTITVIQIKRKVTIVPPVVDDGNLAEAGSIFIYSTINLIISMTKIRIAESKPNFPIS
jgi:hypothetical protein